MKRVFLIVSGLLFTLATGNVPDAGALPQGSGAISMTSVEITKLRKTIERDEKELREFRKMIRELGAAANDTNNARRQRLINSIQDTMVREILQLEEKIGEEFFVRKHGQIERRDRSETRPKGSAAVFSPNHQRLSQMQGVYRVCSRAREPAINKHERGLEAYLERAETFAVLLEEDLRSTRAMLPPDSAEKSKASMW